jgi:hypothetical protein
MKRVVAATFALMISAVTSCSGGNGSGAPSPTDGGTQHVMASCGVTGESCCNGTACNAGLTCIRGVCSASSGRSGSAGKTDAGSGSSTSRGAVDAGSGCVIGGTTYAVGTSSPVNACQGCEPTSSRTAWSNAPDGTTCGTAGLCRAGTCVSGCEVGGVYYVTNALNPTNACQGCAPGTSTSTWTSLANGTSCGNGQLCAGGTCDPGCNVDDAGIVASGTTNEDNPCQRCEPGTTTSGWSSATDGTTCGTGGVCHAGGCVSGCEIGDVYYPSNAPNPTNACQTCAPGTSTSTWHTLADGATCGNGQICASGTCGMQCDIGDAGIVASGTTNPDNPCLTCQPGTSATAWSSTYGAVCGTDDIVQWPALFCDGAYCVFGCVIDGTVYVSGEVNPLNDCLACEPTISPIFTSNWYTDVGASCGSGLICDSFAICGPIPVAGQ